jgi:hypothetical protein
MPTGTSTAAYQATMKPEMILLLVVGVAILVFLAVGFYLIGAG